MAALLADCPKTGKPLKVYVMRAGQTVAHLLFKSTTLLCMHCQEYHHFDKEDLYTEDNQPIDVDRDGEKRS